jgi:hypothetical protein
LASHSSTIENKEPQGSIKQIMPWHVLAILLRPLTIATAAFGFTFLHCLKVVFISTATTIDKLLTLLRGRIVKVAREVGFTKTGLGREGAKISVTLFWHYTRVTLLHIAIGTETTYTMPSNRSTISCPIYIC